RFRLTVQIRGTIRTTPRIIPKRQKTAALQKLAHFLRRFPNSQSFRVINWGFLRLNKRILDCAGKAQLPWRFFQGGVEPRVHLTPADSRSPATLSEEKRCRAAFATAVQKSAAIASL